MSEEDTEPCADRDHIDRRRVQSDGFGGSGKITEFIQWWEKPYCKGELSTKALFYCMITQSSFVVINVDRSEA